MHTEEDGQEGEWERGDEELLQTRLSPGRLYLKLQTDGYLNFGQDERRNWREAPEEKEPCRRGTGIQRVCKACLFLTSEGQERPKTEKSGDIS